MRLLRHATLLAFAVLGACSALTPYATTPAAPDSGTADAGSRVAICYNTLHSALEKVRAEAQAECPANTTAEPVETDYNLVHCPLLLPGRATFVCAPKR